MSSRLNGKTVFVTAAGQGIGRAIAVACAKEGAKVLASDVNEGLLSGLQEEAGCEVATFSLDVRNDQAIRETAMAYPDVDVLVNAAGYVNVGTVLDCTDAEFSSAMELNVLSMVRTIRAFLPKMLDRDCGSIINVASVVGGVKGVPNRLIYGTTKGAVIALTRSVAADFADRQIRCNAICPGTVESPSLRQRIDQQALATQIDAEEVEEAFALRQPMRRFGRAEEIAALAVYLASDESTFTTGTAQIVDGGWSN